MAKILIADDNSNVQKTVTLALANLGIEFLSVNNGDAAVRKLAEFSPDLVLADIFMPVRNGYEVCEYVKKDNRFAHVPVVLLVGAFDPLDEREAQRVGADGILKKPFVPPDPLITMVKTLLERTLGEQLVEVSVSKPAVAARARSGGGVIAEERPPVAVAPEEPPAPEFPTRAGRVAFGDGEHPVAFSQMLETPEQDGAAPSTGLIEPVDDEQILTSSRDATLGDPIFWRNDEPESEPEPESENLDDEPTSLGMRAWKLGDDSLPRRDETALLQPIEPIGSIEYLGPNEPLELIREGQDETSQTVVESGSILLDAAGQAPLTVDSDRAEELAANPIEWMATAPSEHSLETSPELSQEHSPELSVESEEDASDETPGWDEPIPDASDLIDAEGTAESAEHGAVHQAEDLKENRVVLAPAAAPEPTPVSNPVSVRVSPPASVPEPVQPLVPAVSSVTATPAPPIPSSVRVSAPAKPEAKLPAVTLEPSKTSPFAPPPAQSTEDTARSVSKKDWADLSASAQPRPSEVVPQKVTPATVPTAPIATVSNEKSQPVPGKPDAVSSPDPALVEAVVQRVLDKMRPQVVDIITKEFLRPIVQALVSREIEKH